MHSGEVCCRVMKQSNNVQFLANSPIHHPPNTHTGTQAIKDYVKDTSTEVSSNPASPGETTLTNVSSVDQREDYVPGPGTSPLVFSLVLWRRCSALSAASLGSLL